METAISKVTDIHDLLCDAVAEIEYYFGYNMVMIIGVAFFNLVFNSYYILCILFDPYEYVVKWLDKSVLVGILSLQIFAILLQVFAIVEMCNKTVQQNNNISMNIHKILNTSDTHIIKEKLRFFAMQWKNRPVCFTAAGVFSLNRTLYLTVSLITFYSVIL